ncbi:hypothetical protein Tco_0355329 [Tanacetum coccineum]
MKQSPPLLRLELPQTKETMLKVQDGRVVCSGCSRVSKVCQQNKQACLSSAARLPPTLNRRLPPVMNLRSKGTGRGVMNNGAKFELTDRDTKD